MSVENADTFGPWVRELKRRFNELELGPLACPDLIGENWSRNFPDPTRNDRSSRSLSLQKLPEFLRSLPPAIQPELRHRFIGSYAAPDVSGTVTDWIRTTPIGQLRKNFRWILYAGHEEFLFEGLTQRVLDTGDTARLEERLWLDLLLCYTTAFVGAMAEPTVDPGFVEDARKLPGYAGVTLIQEAAWLGQDFGGDASELLKNAFQIIRERMDGAEGLRKMPATFSRQGLLLLRGNCLSLLRDLPAPGVLNNSRKLAQELQGVLGTLAQREQLYLDIYSLMLAKPEHAIQAIASLQHLAEKTFAHPFSSIELRMAQGYVELHSPQKDSTVLEDLCALQLECIRRKLSPFVRRIELLKHRLSKDSKPVLATA